MSLYKSLCSVVFITVCIQFAVTPLQGMQHLRALGVQTAKAARSAKQHLGNLKPQTKMRLTVGVTSLAATGLLYSQTSNFFKSQVPNQQMPPMVKGEFVSAKNECTSPNRTSDEERAKINQLLDQHCDDIALMFELCYSFMTYEQRENKTGARYIDGTVVEFPWLPGYVIKTDPSRVEGAQAFADCIEKYNLNHVAVPEKWLYKIPLRYRITTLGQYQFLVIAKKIERKAEANCAINLEQARDLCCVLRNTRYQGGYYCDFQPSNLFQTTDGQIVFIDTETGGFGAISPALALIMCATTMKITDDRVSEFLGQQLAQVAPDCYVNVILNERLSLLALAARRLGYEKNHAYEEVKKNLQHYVASLDERAIALYEEKVKASVDCMYEQYKSSPEALTKEQSELIKTVFKPGVYIKLEDCQKYQAVLAAND